MLTMEKLKIVWLGPLKTIRPAPPLKPVLDASGRPAGAEAKGVRAEVPARARVRAPGRPVPPPPPLLMLPEPPLPPLLETTPDPESEPAERLTVPPAPPPPFQLLPEVPLA